MEFSGIVGQPGRYVVHQGGVFRGEGWLLNFRMWEIHEKDGVLQCVVDFGDCQTYIWLTAALLHNHELLTTPDKHTFLVYAEETMTHDGRANLMKVAALKWGGEWIMCREQP